MIAVQEMKKTNRPDSVGKNRIKRRNPGSGLIPCELLQMGRRQRRSGSLHTYPCRLLPFRCPWQLPMRDIHSRRFRIRYISLCQRLLPTRSLQRICFREKKKRVSITSCLQQEAVGGEKYEASSTSTRVPPGVVGLEDPFSNLHIFSSSKCPEQKWRIRGSVFDFNPLNRDVILPGY